MYPFFIYKLFFPSFYLCYLLVSFQKSHVMQSSVYASLHLVTMMEHAYQMGVATLVFAPLNGRESAVRQVTLWMCLEWAQGLYGMKQDDIGYITWLYVPLFNDSVRSKTKQDKLSNWFIRVQGGILSLKPYLFNFYQPIIQYNNVKQGEWN